MFCFLLLNNLSTISIHLARVTSRHQSSRYLIKEAIKEKKSACLAVCCLALAERQSPSLGRVKLKLNIELRKCIKKFKCFHIVNLD